MQNFDFDREEWDANFALLSKFVGEKSRLPRSEWIRDQRILYRKNLLSLERIKLLKSVRFWNWKDEDEQWVENYHILINFVNEKGRLPSYNDEIGVWVTKQRTEYTLDKLGSFKIKLLESVKFWNWKTGSLFSEISEILKISEQRVPNLEEETESEHEIEIDGIWMENYNLFADFISKYNELPTSKNNSLNYDEKRLFTWMMLQRKQYREMTLSGKKIELLESLALWKWKNDMIPWEENYQKLANFVVQHGCFPCRTSDIKLYEWVSVQKSFYSHGKLTKDKVELFERIDGWKWNEQRTDWEINYMHLTRLITTQDRIPRGKTKLGFWVNEQIRLRDYLSNEQITMLEKLKHWSWAEFKEDIVWENMYNDLVQTIEKIGKMPNQVEDPGLSFWIYEQKNKYSKYKLTHDEIQKLEVLPDWSWSLPEKKRKRNTNSEISEDQNKRIKIEENTYIPVSEVIMIEDD